MKALVLALALLSGPALADPAGAVEWKATLTPDAELPGPAPREVENDFAQTIRYARYAEPTRRYPHGALGDDTEYGALQVAFINGIATEAVLPENEVFEDEAPRIVDLDGFGRDTVVTIVSSKNEGARVAFYAFKDTAFSRVAATPPIGTPNRWLNIAGIDDFDGSGSSSIAVVRTPHIDGTLQFWRWSRGTLTLTAEAGGFSNHQYGSPEQRLSATEDFDGDGVTDLALPSFDRRSLRLVRLADRRKPRIETIAEIPFPAAIDKAIGVQRIGETVLLTVGLADGTVWTVQPAT